MKSVKNENSIREDQGFFTVVMGDGFFLLSLVSVALVVAGSFALFLCLTGQFLPHDVEYLRLTALQLTNAGNPQLVSFMFHDRAAFGGSLITIGLLYLWLVNFPLRMGMAWAWWVLVLSGSAGFMSFLSYLGYGYLDSWHGVATLALLPLYLAGLVLTHGRLSLDADKSWRRLSRGRRCLPVEVPADLGDGFCYSMAGDCCSQGESFAFSA